MHNRRRVSVLEEDPAFDPDYASRVTVFLDGEPLEFCLTADEVEGVAVVCQLNMRREPIQRNGVALTRTRRGVVVIQDHTARIH